MQDDEQENYYFWCECEQDVVDQNLDDYEKEAEFIEFFRSQSEENKEKICNSVEEAYIEAKKEHSENCAHE